MMGDVDAAIEDVVNDSISNLEDEKPVVLDLDNVKSLQGQKDNEEFNNILSILDLTLEGQDYFRRWYIDGRIYFHKVIDLDNPKEGLKDIRYVDPRKIRKVREVKKEKDKKTQVTLVKDVDEYFVFDEKGIALNSSQQYKTDVVNDKAIKVSKDAVCYCTSGLVDQDKNIPLSFLHKGFALLTN